MPAMVALYKTAWGRVFGCACPPTAKPQTHHRRHDAQARSRRLGVLQSGLPFNPALHGALTRITVSALAVAADFSDPALLR